MGEIVEEKCRWLQPTVRSCHFSQDRGFISKPCLIPLSEWNKLQEETRRADRSINCLDTRHTVTTRDQRTVRPAGRELVFDENSTTLLRSCSKANEQRCSARNAFYRRIWKKVIALLQIYDSLPPTLQAQHKGIYEALRYYQKGLQSLQVIGPTKGSEIITMVQPFFMESTNLDRDTAILSLLDQQLDHYQRLWIQQIQQPKKSTNRWRSFFLRST